MRSLYRIVLPLALGIASLLAGGCSHRDPADSNIPWGRPAAWEDRVPGMDGL